jgi:hypothetical protein
MSTILYSVSSVGVKELLDGNGYFVLPAKILSDLLEAQATKALADSSYETPGLNAPSFGPCHYPNRCNW